MKKISCKRFGLFFYSIIGLTAVTPIFSLSSCGKNVSPYFLINDQRIVGLTDLGRKQQQLVIPDGIMGIGENALQNCIALENVTIPNSVTWIGDHAFEGCSSLSSITFQGDKISIGKYAFNGCNKATYNIFSPTVQDSLLASESHINDSQLRNPYLITISGDPTVHDVNDEGKKQKYLFIPRSITKIDQYAFLKCSNLIKIDISPTVSEIGQYAFSECSSLTHINLPVGVTTIGEGAFSKCISLEEIVLPNSINHLGNNVLSGCSDLKLVTIQDGVTIGDAFGGCPLTTEYYVFSQTYKQELMRLNIQDSQIIYVHGDFVIQANRLVGVSEIGKTKTSIEIPSTITTIEDYAFKGCSSLMTVTIPQSVTYIGKGVFDQCDKLNDVTNNSLVLFDWWVNHHQYDVTLGGNPALMSLSQLPNIDLNLFGNSEDKPFVKIGVSAFENCAFLIKVIISQDITVIDDNAFWGCLNLTNLTIGDHVTSIGNCSFWNCISLLNFRIPASVQTIGYEAFVMGERSSTIGIYPITFLGNNIKIGNYAFYGRSYYVTQQYNVLNPQVRDALINSKSMINPSTIKLILTL